MYLINKNNNKNSLFDKITQFALPIFTILGFLLTSLKMPELGLVFNFISQIFWLHASYLAWKKANQIGIFITTIIITLILLYGILNYWLIK